MSLFPIISYDNGKAKRSYLMLRLRDYLNAGSRDRLRVRELFGQSLQSYAEAAAAVRDHFCIVKYCYKQIRSISVFYFLFFVHSKIRKEPFLQILYMIIIDDF